jgi:translocation and assembly module TamB
VRLLRRLLASLLIAVLLGVAMASFAVLTETGLRWTLATLQATLPATVEVGSVEGRLAGPLTVTNLSYRDDAFQLSISRLVLHWRPAELLQRRLQISLLKADVVEVVTAPSPTTERPSQATLPALPDIRLPLSIRLAEAGLESLTIRTTDGAEQFSARHIQTALDFDGHTLSVQRLQGSSAGLSLSLEGQLTPAGTYPLSVDAHYALNREGLPPVKGKLTASGDLRRLEVEHHTLEPVDTRLVASLTNLLAKPTWDARLQLEQLDAQAIEPDWPPLTAEGIVHSQGSLEAYRFELKARLGGARVPEGEWSLSGIGGPQMIDVRRLRGDTEAGNVSGQLRVEDMLSTPRWKATLQVEQLDTAGFDAGWEALVVDGSARSQGSLDDYSFEAQAHVAGNRIPEGQWSLAGSGDRRVVEVQRVRGETLGGTISGNLRVQVDPHLEWRFNTEATAINPGVHWPDWPGKVNFALRGAGSRQHGRYRAQADLMRMSGTLEQQPISGRGSLTVDQTGFAISALDLRVAGAHLSASGKLSDRWALNWDLMAPDLAALYPPSQGSLSASGRLNGPRNNPDIRMRVQGERLGFQQYRAHSLRMELDWTPQQAATSRLDLLARDLALGGLEGSRLEIKGSGLANDHRIRLEMDTAAVQLASDVRGSYREGNWQGSLASLDLSVPPTGDWRLEKPVRLQVSAQQASLSTLCLASRRETGRACVDGSWSGGAIWQAELRAHDLPLDLLAALLAEDTGVEGAVQIKVQAGQSESQGLQAQLELSSAGGAFLYTTADRERVSLDYRDLLVTGRLREGVARLDGGASLGKTGRVETRLELPLAALKPPSQRIEGTLTARLDELGFVHALIPEVGGVKGALALDLELRGTVKEPKIDLDLALKEGEISLPAQGVTLRDIRVHAEPGAKGMIPFRGQVSSGEGHIELTGTFEPGREEGWRVTLAVRGSRFQVIDVTEYRAVISPDLKVEMTTASARVDGKVVIPQARLRPRQLGGAERPSSDVVIVREKEEKKPGLALYSRVRFELGDHVRFDGFGLKGRFTGSVVVTDAPNQLVRGTGELRIKDGSYKAYGQNLKIERGRLILVGGPIDNPGLDIRAVREVGDVTAGLHITGEVQDPKVAVFSDPPMSETEALSYLVLGRPLPQDDTEEREKVTSASAALALGVGTASLLGEKFGEQVGIDEVGLETESDTGEVKLKLGTYLTPDLYVSYGRGLANQINSFLVRYQLTRKLSVEGESSSEAQGGDIFYTIERP